MNNINENAISSILSIVLICMIALLMILSIWYLILKRRTKNNNKKTSKENITISDKNDKAKKQNKKSSINANYNMQPLTDFMEFDKIEDNMIVQKKRKKVFDGSAMPRC